MPIPGGTCGLAFSIVLAAGPAVAAEVRQEAVGCKSAATVERLQELQTATDPDTYRNTLNKQLGLGECRRWQVGDEVVRKDGDADLTCFAAKGSGICYWSAATLTD